MMSRPRTAQQLLALLASVCTFLVFAVSLCLPSGYALGGALLSLVALASLAHWRHRTRPLGATGWLAFSILLMALVWLRAGEPFVNGFKAFELPFKYVLAALCLLFLRVFPPGTSWLYAGLIAGSISSGLLALYQVHVLELERANGFTNAIQFGDISLLMGLMCLAVLAVRPRRMQAGMQLALLAGMVLGVLGSLLSQARGGWLALILAFPVLCWLLARWLPWRRFVKIAALSLTILAAITFMQIDTVEQRIGDLQQDITLYRSGDPGVTSVGQRLHHWQLAWNMALERPLTGWGSSGYTRERVRRVEAGLAHPSVLEFLHAHNEMLDMFAKQGLTGLTALLLFYGVPLWLFWPTCARLRRSRGSPADGGDALALRIAGVLIPLSTVGFGVTQVFFAHNSGNLCYLFFTVVTFACLHDHAPKQPGNGDPPHARSAGQ